jgi:ADP-ribose pyrophosphatase YjhB (NUDIX family)
MYVHTCCTCLVYTGHVTGLVFVKRKDVGRYAIVGGFVDIGETVEEAVIREVYTHYTALHI